MIFYFQKKLNQKVKHSRGKTNVDDRCSLFDDEDVDDDDDEKLDDKKENTNVRFRI